MWTTIMTFSAFRKAKQQESLRKILVCFTEMDEGSSLEAVRNGLFQILLEFKILKNTSHEIIDNLLSTLEVMLNESVMSDSDSLKVKFSELCFELIAFPWKCVSKLSSKCFIGVVKNYIAFSADVVRTIEQMSDTLRKFCKADLEESVELENQFPSLTKKTFPLFFKATFESCVRNCCQVSSQFAILSVVYESMSSIFSDLLDIACDNAKSAVLLSVSMKCGKMFIDEIVKKVVVFDKFFNEYEEEIRQILKKVQKGTRKLQTICAHCKKLKSAALANSVPACRKSLELFIFKVKDLFIKHNKGSIFTQSVLKAKTLQGDSDSEGEVDAPTRKGKKKRKREKENESIEADVSNDGSDGNLKKKKKKRKSSDSSESTGGTTIISETTETVMHDMDRVEDIAANVEDTFDTNQALDDSIDTLSDTLVENNNEIQNQDPLFALEDNWY
jgi:hypothetical protein